MTVILALEKLFDDVDAAFLVGGFPARTNRFGWRTPAEQREALGPRIDWVPGDPGGALGAFGPARNPGRNPRPLATLAELFTCTISAVDPAAPEDERAQYKATRLLADAWVAAVYKAAHGTFVIRSANWLDKRQTRRAGAALRIVCALEAMIPDEVKASAPFTTRAVVGVHELDVDESFETAPAPLSVRAAALANLELTGEQTVDGVDLVDGDLVLAPAQSDAIENGPYIVRTGAWERTDDVLGFGFFVHVVEGDTLAAAGFQLTTADPITVGVTPLLFEKTTP